MSLLKLSLLSLASAHDSLGYLAFPIQRTTTTINSTSVVKRDLETAEASNWKTAYIATIGLGNPPQEFQVFLDTGSSDLWVWGEGSGAPITYNPANSPDSHDLKSPFQIGYVGGDAVSGEYYTDLFTWGDINCTLQFAVTNHYSTVDTTMTVFGIFYNSGYSNLPQTLKDQGYINSVAYSLYLDDYDAADGTILFGAVDTSKFNGSLTIVNAISEHSAFYPVTIDGNQYNAVLDSGTTLMYIPENILNATIEQNWEGQVTYDPQQKLYRLNSDTRPSGTLTISFNDVDIVLDQEALWMKLAHNAWYLVIGTSDEVGGIILLGDVFLRSAYVVYDLENSRIAIAPANYDDSESNLEVITGNYIPGTN